jgi:2-haloacid dehalogenase
MDRKSQGEVIDLAGVELLSFDCYGTLIDWEMGLGRALSEVCDRHGVSAGGEQLLQAFGAAETAVELETVAQGFLKYRAVLERVLLRMGEDLGFVPGEEEVSAFAGSVGEWPAFGDTQGALLQLARHCKLAILSNVDNDLFRASAPRLGVPFEHVFTAEDIGSYKPSPRNFEYLIGNVKTPKAGMLHVAQSLYHDIGPARDAGLRTVWVNRRMGKPGTGATPPSNAKPDLEVPSLAALAELIHAAHGG